MKKKKPEDQLQVVEEAKGATEKLREQLLSKKRKRDEEAETPAAKLSRPEALVQEAKRELQDSQGLAQS